ncbi:MAG: hypothetical protein FWB80_05865 [Defluviitaleaceae bacterium]|nr:hypothetical protein [Defluviitaleaceae bacterium]
MVVTHNVPALFTHLSMRRADRGLQQAMTRLSSGVRINSAREDAAGLAIANKLNYQVGGLRRASENATHGISLIQTAEGALNEVHNMLQRMRELSVQAAHGTLTDENRSMIHTEIEQLTAEIHSISRNTEFNRMRILNGEASRVVDNQRWQQLGGAGTAETVASRNIVNTLYVSHQVPPGQLNYTIQQAGRPAMIPITPQLSQKIVETHLDPATNTRRPTTNPPTWVFPDGHGFTLNGVAFDLSGKRWEDVQSELNEQLQYMGISLVMGEGAVNDPTFVPPPIDPATGLPPGFDPNNPSLTPWIGAANPTLFLVSNIAGSDQKITISGEMSMLGINLQERDVAGFPVFSDPPANTIPVMVQRITSQGTDARVTTSPPASLSIGADPVRGGLLDINGDPIAGASLAATAVGNQVRFRGSMGEDIRMNIQVMFDPSVTVNLDNLLNPAFTGHTASHFFRFPGIGGEHISQLETGGAFAGGLHMSKEFRSFGPIMLQIGPSHNTAMPVQIPRLNAETLGLIEYVGGQQRSIIDIRPTAVVSPGGGVRQVGAERAINIADAAIQTVSNTRARLGAYQNRLESTVRNLDVAAENTEISRSRIQDTDMARETTRFAQYNVIFQAAMSILGQANQRPQQIIQLLQ